MRESLALLIGSARSPAEAEARIAEWQRKDAEAVAMTLYRTMAMSDMAGQMFVRLIEVRAVMDTRTTTLCEGLDGKQWRITDPNRRLSSMGPQTRSLSGPFRRGRGSKYADVAQVRGGSGRRVDRIRRARGSGVDAVHRGRWH